MHDEGERRVAQIRAWGKALGFDAIGITGVAPAGALANLNNWLAAGAHGTMDYMTRHGDRRARADALLPGTRSVISARLSYRPQSADMAAAQAVLDDPTMAYISRYALGRDYHTLLRKRLQALATRMLDAWGEFAYRVFSDSAPVMEVALATQAGIGWRGKHTLLLDRTAGSWFFLGEILLALDLPPDAPVADHCGSCTACLDVCPTAAFDAPYRLDARRCISYLTIEHAGDIPEHLRGALGNRVYGCDDCQLVCPWNRRAPAGREADFLPRNGLEAATLVSLFAWSESQFLERLAGSPIRRIGYARWLRNIAVALGNAPHAAAVVQALQTRRDDPSALVREHVTWALGQQAARAAPPVSG